MQMDEQNDLKDQVDEMDKQITIEKARIDRSGRSHLGKAAKIMRRRMLKKGVDAWKDTLKKQDTEGAGAERIIQRLKRKMLRKGF